jgi:hypothetical protein
MASIAELKARREALLASRASGVARVSYDGRSVDYRSLAEIDRAIEALDRRLLPRAGRYAYWKPFEIYAVEQALSEYRNAIIDFGDDAARTEDRAGDP